MLHVHVRNILCMVNVPDPCLLHEIRMYYSTLHVVLTNIYSFFSSMKCACHMQHIQEGCVDIYV